MRNLIWCLPGDVLDERLRQLASGGNLCGVKPFPHQGTYREMKAWGAASATQQQARYT